jgi:cytochrome c553
VTAVAQRRPGVAAQHLRAWLCAALVGVSMAGAQADPMERRARACTGCHGEQGRAASDGFYPRIAGKPAAYLYEQLLAFRDGRRRYALMTHLLEPLSDAFLRDLAEHFAALNLPHAAPQPLRGDAAAWARAEQLARQGDATRQLPACAACHGERLTGVLPALPALVGLPRDYLNAQLGAWRSGARAARAPDCMGEIARRLALEDIAALSAWLAAQPVPQPARAAPDLPQAMPLRCGATAAVRP